jgi:hypothetical protein
LATSGEKCDAKEIMWAQTGKPACGKESAHDGSHGRNSERNRDSPNNPPAMKRNPSPPDMKEGSGHGEQEQSVEEKDRQHFSHPANRMPDQEKRRETDDGS